MSLILYYSNYCRYCTQLLQLLTKIDKKDIHFICIDKRQKDTNGKTYIILENNQKILFPPNIHNVPALLNIQNNYQIIYGDDIYNYLKPNIENQIKTATNNNFEPIAYDLSSQNSNTGIISDNFSFYDLSEEQLATKGNGGLRQMHNYYDINYKQNIDTINTNDSTNSNSKIKEGQYTIEQLIKQRESESSSFQRNY